MDFTQRIKGYNDMMYDSGPVSWRDFVSDRYNRVHDRLYRDALGSMLTAKAEELMGMPFFLEAAKLSAGCRTAGNAASEATSGIYPYAGALMEWTGGGKAMLTEIYTAMDTVIYKVLKATETGDVSCAPLLGPVDGLAVVNGGVRYALDGGRLTSGYPFGMTDAAAFSPWSYAGQAVLYTDGRTYTLDLSRLPAFPGIDGRVASLGDVSHTSLAAACAPYAVAAYRSSHRIIELKADEYWKPSVAVSVRLARPYGKESYDLTGWWNTSCGRGSGTLKDMYIRPDGLNDACLTGIDYVRGTAKMRSRHDGYEFEAAFDRLDPDTSISPDFMLDNMFSVNKK
jgi:hypothetical protein